MIGKDWSSLKKLMVLGGASGVKAVEDTVVGNPVQFLTGLAKKLKSLNVSFTPVQSGTGDPSPENVRPISGMDGVNVWHTGKNLLFNDTISAEGNQFFLCASSTSYPFHLKPGKYTLSHEGKQAFAYYQKVGGSGTLIHGNTVDYGTFTIAEEADYRIWYYTSGATASDFTNVQLEVGESATTYEAPQVGTSYSIAFPVLGKNLLDPSRRTAEGENVRYYRSEKDFLLKGGQTYTLTANVTSDQLSIFDSNNTTLASTYSQSLTYTPTEDVSVWFDLYVANAHLPEGGIFAVYGMLELGDTAHPYEPYTNTVYGGTLDLTTGVLTATWAKTTVSAISSLSKKADNIFECYLGGRKNGTGVFTIISDSYKTITQASSTGSTIASLYAQYGDGIYINSGSKTFYICDADYTDAETFKTDRANVEISYELATPVTLATLTPQQISALIGNNTMLSNVNGDIEVKYLKKG